jgi:hypothetical protein
MDTNTRRHAVETAGGKPRHPGQKGVKMRAYSSMPAADFVYQLRTIAINAKAHPLVLDQIDALVPARTEDEIEEDCLKAVEEAEKHAFKDAEQAVYDDCVAAIEAKGAEIGLSEDQIYKVVNHILWDCRP